MKYSDYRYDVTVVDQRALDGFSNDGRITSGCLVFVYDAGTKTGSTIYSDSNRTAKTAPISRAQFATDGKIVFYGAAKSYDLVICHSDGSIAFIYGVTPLTHSAKLNRDGSAKCLVVPFTANTSETDTGLDIPVGAQLLPGVVEVVTTESGKTLNVGLLSTQSGGNASGLLTTVPMTTAGFIEPYVVTTGSNEKYVSATYIGALLGIGNAGADTALHYGQGGGFGFVVKTGTATRVTYTSSSASTTAAGYIYLPFRLLR